MNASVAVPLSPARDRTMPASMVRWLVACSGVLLLTVFVLSLVPAYGIRIEGLDFGHIAALETLGLSPQGYVFTGLVLQTLVAATYFAVAAIVLMLAAGNRCALVSAAVLMGVGTAAMQTISALPSSHPGWEWPVRIIEAATLALFLLWLLAFPTGRIRQPVRRWLAVAVVLVALAQIVDIQVLRAAMLPSWAAVMVLVGVALFAGALAVQRPGSNGLRPVLGSFLAVLLTLAAAAACQALLGWGPGTMGDLVLQLALGAVFLAIPVTVAAAVLRQGLWDLQGALARTITASLMTVAAAGSYLVLAVAASVVQLDRTTASVAALIVVLLVIHPLYRWTSRKISRALYGERGNSRYILAQLTRQLAAAGDPAELVVGVADGLRGMLNVPFVRIVAGTASGGARASTAGTLIAGWPVATVGLVHQGVLIGTLELAVRDADQHADTAFTAADLAAVNPLTGQLAALLHAAELELALRLAHQRLVAVREEERRRLRNDLHDGLGQALGAVMMNLAAAQNVLDGCQMLDGCQQEQAQALVAESRAAVKAAVAEIRRLVYELRPPALDERGLLEALRAAVAAMQSGPMLISVEGSLLCSEQDSSARSEDSAPILGAAVEIAAYRIALEAVHNAARHSGASHCTVSFSCTWHSATGPGWLRLAITDDGAGLPRPVTTGVGLESMAQRAAEAGGNLTFEIPAGGGTTVLASLPLKEAPASSIPPTPATAAPAPMAGVWGSAGGSHG